MKEKIGYILLAVVLGLGVYYKLFEEKSASEESVNNSKYTLPQLLTEIKVLEGRMFSGDPSQITKEDAEALAGFYKDYALNYSTTPEAAEYTFKAAEVFMGLRNGEEVLAMADLFMKNFPQDEKAPLSLFIKALAYDDLMGNVEMAKKTFETFLEKYPTSEYADDAQALMSQLGMTDEEKIKMLQEQNQDVLEENGN